MSSNNSLNISNINIDPPSITQQSSSHSISHSIDQSETRSIVETGIASMRERNSIANTTAQENIHGLTDDKAARITYGMFQGFLMRHSSSKIDQQVKTINNLANQLEDIQKEIDPAGKEITTIIDALRSARDKLLTANKAQSKDYKTIAAQGDQLRNYLTLAVNRLPDNIKSNLLTISFNKKGKVDEKGKNLPSLLKFFGQQLGTLATDIQRGH